jgi:acyl-coenzyme A synthetase/AMP-(fatty) acid ligase
LDVAIYDHDGEPVAAGESGEICVSGPAVMSGYWLQPDHTAGARLPGNGASYRTGDYGYVRGDGLMILTGRRDQQAKLRGHRIELLALEAELNAHPGLKEATASVVPDERSGGLLVVHAVALSERPALSEIRTFLAARLAPYYQPDRIEWLSEIPRTATGKCDRSLLRSMAEQSARR